MVLTDLAGERGGAGHARYAYDRAHGQTGRFLPIHRYRVSHNGPGALPFRPPVDLLGSGAMMARVAIPCLIGSAARPITGPASA